jgi:archaellum component FlaC
MTEAERHDLIVAYMRKFDEKLDRIGDDVHNIKGRMTNVEIVLGTLATAHGQMQQSFDRLSDRVERIERRLELLNEAPLGAP